MNLKTEAARLEMFKRRTPDMSKRMLQTAEKRMFLSTYHLSLQSITWPLELHRQIISDISPTNRVRVTIEATIID